MRNGNPITPSMVRDKILRMWAEGKSASVIAKALGLTSRSTVIGFIGKERAAGRLVERAEGLALTGVGQRRGGPRRTSKPPAWAETVAEKPAPPARAKAEPRAERVRSLGAHPWRVAGQAARAEAAKRKAPPQTVATKPAQNIPEIITASPAAASSEPKRPTEAPRPASR
jgi:hypothetical protein